MSATARIDHIKISSLAAPSPEDVAVLQSLSDEQYRALLSREIDKGLRSGVSTAGIEDIWQRAMRRVFPDFV